MRLALLILRKNYYRLLGPVVDPTIVARLVGRRRREDPLGELTEREREVLALVAEGIRAGRFFAWPRTCGRRGPCEFDLACGAERVRWAEAKAADPAAQRHAELEGIR